MPGRGFASHSGSNFGSRGGFGDRGEWSGNWNASLYNSLSNNPVYSMLPTVTTPEPTFGSCICTGSSKISACAPGFLATCTVNGCKCEKDSTSNG